MNESTQIKKQETQKKIILSAKNFRIGIIFHLCKSSKRIRILVLPLQNRLPTTEERVGEWASKGVR